MRYVIYTQKGKIGYVGEKAGFVVLLLAGPWFRDETGLGMFVFLVVGASDWL